ncbi:MAG TPA: TlpA disulfide reductase family protein [Bryobacteraceae bacterium]|nr:TlpA disulfide reductase family protein [Bryobacteraceae bacterium]
MKLLLVLALVSALAGFAQEKDAVSQTEQADLQNALQEAGDSQIDFIHALENHIAKYPNSPRRAEIEKALVKASLQQHDAPRVAKYGVRVLETDPDNLELLEETSAALLKTHDKDAAERALRYSRHAQELVQAMKKETPKPGPEEARHRVELNFRMGQALMLQARAVGTLGDAKKAAEIATSAFAAYANAETAREKAYWLEQAGDQAGAVQALADAFTIEDPQQTETKRAADRDELDIVYRKWKGSEAGLGDIVLAAYDRNRELVHQRRLALKQYDPNVQVSDPMKFTLSGVNGDKLDLASLKGKVVIMDFWATWCGPCRTQHPLYDKLREHFRDRKDVVFLFIDTDEDHSSVPEFVAAQKWDVPVWYEDGLAYLLKVSSIPTTIIFGPDGQLVSRMAGFDPATFVATMIGRIDTALKAKQTAAVAPSHGQR